MLSISDFKLKEGGCMVAKHFEGAGHLGPAAMQALRAVQPGSVPAEASTLELRNKMKLRFEKCSLAFPEHKDAATL